MAQINYRYIADATEYYTKLGYKQVEAPWVVGKEAYYVTKPQEAIDLQLEPWGGYLPASGEQSFLDLLLRGETFYKAFCVTPCFRHEKWDELHLPWFFKVELIAMGNEIYTDSYHGLLSDARRFFCKYIETDLLRTDSGTDIVSNKRSIELGSYGLRKYKKLTWAYGTGVAEPRLSQAIKLENEIYESKNK